MEMIEFGNVEKLRKSILIFSVISIFFKTLVSNSTGNIKMIGFEIPIENKESITYFMGAILIYLLLALLIRFNNDRFKERYKLLYDELLKKNTLVYETVVSLKAKQVMKFEMGFRNKSVYFLDILFPFILGFVALVFCFWDLF